MKKSKKCYIISLVMKMEENNKMSLFERCEIYFSLVEDPRNQSYIIYNLKHILYMVICGMICGAKNLEEIVEILEVKISVLKKYIEVETIPCLATFSNILSILNPERIELCIFSICNNILNSSLILGESEIEEVKELTSNEPIEVSIDGKSIRSTNNHGDPEKALQIVTAYDINNRIPLAQREIEDKTNEITAGRELLKLFDLTNAIITADAIHCQKETVKEIHQLGGDCIIQLKENQKNLYEDIKLLFDDKIADKQSKGEYLEYKETEKNGGRIETRICYVFQGLESYNFLKDKLKDWVGIKNIFCIKRIIEEKGRKSVENSYYLTSLNETAEKLMKYARNHWKIESMHWILDIIFKEDDCPVKSKKTQRILNALRKMAIKIHVNYIEKANPKRKTIASSVRRCLMDNDTLEDVLEMCFK